MLRAALCFGALLSTLMPALNALAHGVPPTGDAVLSHDAEGARAVRMSHGLALRRPGQRFQYVCPSAWGDMYPAPAAALADGTIVVGATSGLKLLSEDGKVRAHPDAVAIGASTEVVHTRAGVFSLRPALDGSGSEVLAIDAQKARVLWKDAKGYTSLAAFEDKLVLLRAGNLMLEQVTISATDGKELERQIALLQAPVDYVYARPSAGALYTLVMFRTEAALGVLKMNTFTKIARGELSVAGPLRSGDSTLLALDGKLSQLMGDQALPLAANDNVLCLAQHDELAYACNTDGIARVSGQTLAEPLFQLRSLIPPDLEPVAAELRNQCNAQWQDLRLDLMMFGTTLLENGSPDPGADAGAQLLDAGVASDASIVPDAVDASPFDAGAAEAGPMSATPPSKEAQGCAALRWRGCNFAAYLYLSILLLLQRRRGVFRSAQ